MTLNENRESRAERQEIEKSRLLSRDNMIDT